ncbi:hypothetical protein YC2023_102512 [Brassica napus]
MDVAHDSELPQTSMRRQVVKVLYVLVISLVSQLHIACCLSIEKINPGVAREKALVSLIKREFVAIFLHLIKACTIRVGGEWTTYKYEQYLH